jgi:hypothetical protein
MTTREQILGLLESGHTYETAARELALAPGLAFMIATGQAADGSERHDGSQRLVNPPPVNPTGKDHVAPWVHRRAARGLR